MLRFFNIFWKYICKYIVMIINIQNLLGDYVGFSNRLCALHKEVLYETHLFICLMVTTAHWVY